MGVRFVIGRAGSGKTRRCFENIVKLVRQDPWGKPILWIVPKQATFEAERALTIELGAFARVRILSFENFGEAVLEECGGAATPEVSAQGRQMILGWLLRGMADKLKFFDGVAKQAGLVAKLDATFVELERCGKTPADLQAAGDETSDGLSKKIGDLKIIYQAYLDYLGQDRFDPHRRLQEVLYRMEGCKLVKDAHIFIDGFLDYREFERRMIAGMAKACAEMEITVLGDPKAHLFNDPHQLPDEAELFYRTESAYRQLYFSLVSENIAIDTPVKLSETQRFSATGIANIERGFLNDGDIEPAEGVEFVRCENRRGEAMAAAAHAAALVAGGMRYRDILVLTRDIDDYAELINAAFIEHGIPCFIDRRRTVGHHPLLQLLRGVLAILRHDWPHDAVMSVIKTGLAGLETSEADELENYVLLHRIRGEKTWLSEEPWTYRRRLVGDEDDPSHIENIEAANSADRLRKKTAAAIGEFSRQMNTAGLTVRQRVTDIFNLFENLHVRQQLEKWMKAAEATGDLEQKGEHEQIWNGLVDLLDEMVQLLGDKSSSLEDFADILDSGLESFDLALTPPTVDQVLVGQVDRTRSTSCRATILLGMNDGQFPLVASEDSILSDSERAELKNRKLELEGDSRQKRMNENLLAYVAMTRSSEKLILMRSVSDEAARLMTPSIYWRMLSNPDGRQFGPRVEDISTTTQAVARLMRWVRRGLPKSPTAEGIYEWLRQSTSSEVARLRQQTWPALQYDNAAKLSEATATALYLKTGITPSPGTPGECRGEGLPSFILHPSSLSSSPQPNPLPEYRERRQTRTLPLVASVSQFETFAACPFKHFLRYGLCLEIREEDDPTALDLGNLYHEALRKIVTATLKEKLDWANLPAQMANDLVWNCTEEVGQELREELMISSARNRHLLGWIGRTLKKVTAGQQAAARRGDFRPALAEMPFGESARVPALNLTTPKGRHVDLRGKIDRVDLSRDGEAFSVVDYKTSHKKVEINRVWHGLSLQLLVYMLVMSEHAEKIFKTKTVAAAGFYVELIRRLQSVEDPDEEIGPDDPRFDLRVKPRGLVRQDFLNAFDAELVPGTSSDVLPVRLKKDGTPYENSTDVITSDDLQLLLNYVRTKVGELADQIIDGSIDVRPYRLGTETPCPNCEYNTVCRFQVGVGANRYLHVAKTDRKIILEQLRQFHSRVPGQNPNSKIHTSGGKP